MSAVFFKETHHTGRGQKLGTDRVAVMAYRFTDISTLFEISVLVKVKTDEISAK